jgi:Protein of unknown function DUF262
VSDGLGTQPTATTIDVEQLAKWAWEGRIRIPHFQRPLRWQRDDVIKLFDSIVRGYPVGSLLLWRRPAQAETVQLGALRIDAPELSRALWVVDGQQRITGLANALHPDGQSDDRFRISYDLRKRIFVPTPKDTTRGDVIPLPVIFDLREVLRWFADHPETIDHVDEVNQITQTIRQFKVPAYEVDQDDPQILEDIFDRLNNYGKRLTRAEIFSALFAGEESDKDVTPTLDRIAQDMSDDLDFGLIDNDTVLQAILGRRAPDVLRQIRTEFGPDARITIDVTEEDRDTAYRLGEEALRRAVQFLQTVAGVPHFTLLPYKYLLVVLTRLFAHHPLLDERDQLLVRRWFWRAALVGPEIFRGNTTGAVRLQNRAIQPGDLEGSIRRLLDLIPWSAARAPDLKRFRSNEAATKLVLCSWWSLGPRSLPHGSPFDVVDLAESIGVARTPVDAVKTVIPTGLIPRDLRPWAANRVLYPAMGVDDFGPAGSLLINSATGPDFKPDTWAQTLASHCVTPEMLSSLASDDTEEFLDFRQRALERQLRAFLDQRCEWDFEDTPSLDSLVLDDEDETRDLSDDESSRY